jgi:hypothetical protein
MQHIGTGQATTIDEIAIQWPGASDQQIFKKVPVDALITIKQNNQTFTTTRLKKFDFNKVTPNIIDCFPQTKTPLASN